MPLLTNYGTGDGWYISTLIIEKPSHENQELQRIFSFDTMSETDITGSHADVAFIKEIRIKVLNKEKIQCKSDCVLYTAFVVEKFLNNTGYLENLIEKSDKPNNEEISYKLRDEIIDSIKNKFVGLFNKILNDKKVEIDNSVQIIVKRKGCEKGVANFKKCGKVKGVDNSAVLNENSEDVDGPEVSEVQKEELDQ